MGKYLRSLLLFGGLVLAVMTAAACSPGSPAAEVPGEGGSAIKVYESPT